MNTICPRSPAVIAPSGSVPSGEAAAPCTSDQKTVSEPAWASGATGTVVARDVFAAAKAAARAVGSAADPGGTARLAAQGCDQAEEGRAEGRDEGERPEHRVRLNGQRARRGP